MATHITYMGKKKKNAQVLLLLYLKLLNKITNRLPQVF